MPTILPIGSNGTTKYLTPQPAMRRGSFPPRREKEEKKDSERGAATMEETKVTRTEKRTNAIRTFTRALLSMVQRPGIVSVMRASSTRPAKQGACVATACSLWRTRRCCTRTPPHETEHLLSVKCDVVCNSHMHSSCQEVSGRSIPCGAPVPKTKQARLCCAHRFAKHDGHQPYLFFLPFLADQTRGWAVWDPLSRLKTRDAPFCCSCWFPARYSRLKQARAAARPLYPWDPW